MYMGTTVTVNNPGLDGELHLSVDNWNSKVMETNHILPGEDLQVQR